MIEDFCKLTDELISYAKKNLGLRSRDEIYARNNLLALFRAPSYAPTGATNDDCVPDNLARAVNALTGENVADKVFGMLSLRPSEVEDEFSSRCIESAKKATDWLYDYSVKNGYVKKSALDANPRFEEGGLIVTINKSKPEFRDAKKAVSGNSVAGGYPLCTICRDNEGYEPREKNTLRTVSVTLGEEEWFWQYSPYGYFHEHGIAVNSSHTPMNITAKTFERLLDFVDVFPHYFIGSNAPLPRIGGSVLAHDHFQGGGEILPLHTAKAKYVLGYADTTATVEVLDWEGTAIRIVSGDRHEVAKLAEIIRSAWVVYDDEALGIVSKDGDGPHNAISPTVRKTERGYEMTVLLRCNVTSEKYPDGVFHAHPEFHVIKKESIGLIEAQGLFILPGRLESELAVIEECLVEGKPLPEDMKDYEFIFGEIKALCPSKVTAKDAHNAVKRELGSVCKRILKNTAVFDGEQTVKFLRGLGFTYNG